MRLGSRLQASIRPILGAIESVPVPAHLGHQEAAPPAPFITVSREPGAAAWTSTQEFVRDINAGRSDTPQWTCWDRELVEKVAADHRLSQRLIDSLDESRQMGLLDVLGGLSYTCEPEEAAVYHRVSATITALAQAGHVVIVGRGSQFITANLPGGIHLRFVAQLADRIRFIQESQKMSHTQAEKWVAEAERKRARFYKRFWPGKSLGSESFTLTINTSFIRGPEVINLVRSLLETRVRTGLAAP